MAKCYKVIVNTTYTVEKIVKAESKEEVEGKLDEILNKTDLMADDDPQVETTVYERDDYDDDDVDFDLTKKQ